MTQPNKASWIGSASRQAALPVPLRELHRAVLRRFLRTGDPPATGCGSWEVMCPTTTFHASRGSARAYLAARGDIDGQILDQQAAVERGQRNFGTLLQAGPRPGAPTAAGPE